jgi:hypothetical protein
MTESDNPGTLRPRAVWTIAALFRAPGRALVAWQIARQIGDPDGGHVVPLMHDMTALGLIERVGRGVGYASRWRLLVEGPVRLPARRLHKDGAP